jgi:hypothetical protein
MAMKIRKARLRKCARFVLEQRNFKVELKRSQGIIPGARLLVFETEGQKTAREVAVRTSHDREVGLTRHPNGTWVTIPKMDEVIVVVPSEDTPGTADVFGFDPKILITAFDAALDKQKKENPKLSHKVPVFIALDRAKPGADAGITSGLKEKAQWHEVVSIAAVPRNLGSLSGSTADFIRRVKQEFADQNGVDVSTVTVEFRITG